MGIFGPQWEGHPEALFAGWRRRVRDDDVVLIPGDISWAMRLEDALVDLQALAALPGTKVLLRGNHDYWWPSLSKLRALLPSGMFAVQNDAVRVGPYLIAGTRGWITPGSPGFTAADQKIYERELTRLSLSLKALAREGPGVRVAMLHFPPTNLRGEASGFTELLGASQLDALVFGHVHGDAAVPLPELPGVAVHFVAADRIGFEPRLIHPGPAAPVAAEGSGGAVPDA